MKKTIVLVIAVAGSIISSLFGGLMTYSAWQCEQCEWKCDFNWSPISCVECAKICKYERCVDSKPYADSWKTKSYCECIRDWGIKLNTDIPFIGRCITKQGNTADGNSSILGISSALTNIFMTLILTAWFAMVIWWGVEIAMGRTKEGKQKIINVVIAFAALGSLGILLRLINPNFFK